MDEEKLSNHNLLTQSLKQTLPQISSPLSTIQGEMTTFLGVTVGLTVIGFIDNEWRVICPIVVLLFNAYIFRLVLLRSRKISNTLEYLHEVTEKFGDHQEEHDYTDDLLNPDHLLYTPTKNR